MTVTRMLMCSLAAEVLVFAALACDAPAILGGATPATTQQRCPDGTVCATWQACPNFSTPGRCEAPDTTIPTAWGARPAPDAGRR